MDDAVKKLLTALVLDPEMFNKSSPEVPGTFTDMANAQDKSVLGYSNSMLANLGLDKPNFGYNGNTLPVSDMTGAMFDATRPPETPTGYQPGEASFNDMPLPTPNPNPSDMTQDPVAPSKTPAIDELKNLFPEEPAAPIPGPAPAPTSSPNAAAQRVYAIMAPMSDNLNSGMTETANSLEEYERLRNQGFSGELQYY
jgi:hypothetical protein